jgi:hypothetical protein
MQNVVVGNCVKCAAQFSFFNRRHHCRDCGRLFCAACTAGRRNLVTRDCTYDQAEAVRVCNECLSQTTARKVARMPDSEMDEIVVSDAPQKLQGVGLRIAVEHSVPVPSPIVHIGAPGVLSPQKAWADKLIRGSIANPHKSGDNVYRKKSKCLVM